MTTSRSVALVTGGSRGIGRGICLELARQGHALAINYAGNAEAAQETARLILAERAGWPVLTCQADVAVSADRQRLVDAVLEHWGRIDVLVNNAGITSQGRKDIVEASEESWDRVLDVNLKGPFFLIQRAAREMLRLKAVLPGSYRPTIVNITSLSAYSLATNRGDYCISKAGLSMATQLWALRLADEGIRVFEVRPGVIDTDMTAAAREKYTPLIAAGLSPIRRWGSTDDVARAVAMLTSDALPFSTGEVINVDGGFHLRKFPAT